MMVIGFRGDSLRRWRPWWRAAIADRTSATSAPWGCATRGKRPPPPTKRRRRAIPSSSFRRKSTTTTATSMTETNNAREKKPSPTGCSRSVFFFWVSITLPRRISTSLLSVKNQDLWTENGAWETRRDFSFSIFFWFAWKRGPNKKK